jgi:hypothetical protein
MAHDKTFRSERGAQEEQELNTKYGEGAERREGSSDEEPRDKQSRRREIRAALVTPTLVQRQSDHDIYPSQFAEN